MAQSLELTICKMNINDIPKNLIDNFKSGVGVFFVGAGLSRASGLPTWGGLIEELINEAEKLNWVDTAKIDELRSLATDNSKFLFLAEELKIVLGTAYEEYFERRFVESKPSVTENHRNLVRTNCNLVITINYDDIIERAYNEVFATMPNSFIYSDAKKAANNFWKNHFFILKAHGDVKTDATSVILSQQDYRKVLYREPGYRNLLQSIFTTRSVLFVGVSMSDPEFNQLLDYLHDSYHGGGPTHYLLIEQDRTNGTLTRRFKDDFKIEVIMFENSKGDYAELSEFLKLLADIAPKENH